jgi:hypothetical protein
MASIKERVRFPGTLRGEGQEATCTVRAIKVSLPGTAEFAYTDYEVENVSKQLPEGIYQLFTNGETIAVKYRNGFWLAG